MANDWIGLVKKVPWKSVAEAAPAIAEAARRLRDRIDPGRADAPSSSTPPGAAPGAGQASASGAAPLHGDVGDAHAGSEPLARRALETAIAAQSNVDALETRCAELATALEQASRLVADLGRRQEALASALEAASARSAATRRWAIGASGVAALAILVALTVAMAGGWR